MFIEQLIQNLLAGLKQFFTSRYAQFLSAPLWLSCAVVLALPTCFKMVRLALTLLSQSFSYLASQLKNLIERLSIQREERTHEDIPRKTAELSSLDLERPSVNKVRSVDDLRKVFSPEVLDQKIASVKEKILMSPDKAGETYKALWYFLLTSDCLRAECLPSLLDELFQDYIDTQLRDDVLIAAFSDFSLLLSSPDFLLMLCQKIQSFKGSEELLNRRLMRSSITVSSDFLDDFMQETLSLTDKVAPAVGYPPIYYIFQLALLPTDFSVIAAQERDEETAERLKQIIKDCFKILIQSGQKLTFDDPTLLSVMHMLTILDLDVLEEEEKTHKEDIPRKTAEPSSLDLEQTSVNKVRSVDDLRKVFSPEVLDEKIASVKEKILMSPDKAGETYKALWYFLLTSDCLRAECLPSLLDELFQDYIDTQLRDDVLIAAFSDFSLLISSPDFLLMLCQKIQSFKGSEELLNRRLMRSSITVSSDFLDDFMQETLSLTDKVAPAVGYPPIYYIFQLALLPTDFSVIAAQERDEETAERLKQIIKDCFKILIQSGQKLTFDDPTLLSVMHMLTVLDLHDVLEEKDESYFLGSLEIDFSAAHESAQYARLEEKLLNAHVKKFPSEGSCVLFFNYLDYLEDFMKVSKKSLLSFAIAFQSRHLFDVLLQQARLEELFRLDGANYCPLDWALRLPDSTFYESCLQFIDNQLTSLDEGDADKWTLIKERLERSQKNLMSAPPYRDSRYDQTQEHLRMRIVSITQRIATITLWMSPKDTKTHYQKIDPQDFGFNKEQLLPGVYSDQLLMSSSMYNGISEVPIVNDSEVPTVKDKQNLGSPSVF